MSSSWMQTDLWKIIPLGALSSGVQGEPDPGPQALSLGQPEDTAPMSHFLPLQAKPPTLTIRKLIWQHLRAPSTQGTSTQA